MNIKNILKVIYKICTYSAHPGCFPKGNVSREAGSNYVFFTLFFLSLACGKNISAMQAIRNELQYSTASRAAQHGEWENAQKAYNKLLVDAPDNASLLYDSGVASYKNKQFDKSAAYFNKVTELDAVDASLKERAHFNLGNTYVEQNKLDDAIKQYEAALALNPDNEHAQHNLEKVKEMQQQQQQQQDQENQQQQHQKQNQQQNQQQQNGNDQQDQQNKNDQDQQQDKKQDGQQQQGDGQSEEKEKHGEQYQESKDQQQQDEQSKDQSGDSQKEKDKQESGQSKRDTQSEKDQEQRDGEQDMPKDRGQEQQEQQQNAQGQPDQSDQKKTEQEKAQDMGSKHKQDSSEKSESQQGERKPIQVAGTQEDKKQEEETQGFAAQQQEEESKDPYDRFITAVLKEQEQADAQANKRMIKQKIDKELRGEHGQNRW